MGGTGLRGNLHKASPEKVGKKIDQIFDNYSSFLNAAQKIKMAFAEQENCQKGVRFVEKFLRDPDRYAETAV